MPVQCPHCGAVENWNFSRLTNFFTLFFFLKIFPVGSSNYVYACPKCKFGYDILPNNLNQIVSGIQMNNVLYNELNSKKFNKYLAKKSGVIANQQVPNNSQYMSQSVQQPMMNNIQQPAVNNQQQYVMNQNQYVAQQQFVQAQNPNGAIQNNQAVNYVEPQIVGYNPQTGEPIYK